MNFATPGAIALVITCCLTSHTVAEKDVNWVHYLPNEGPRSRNVDCNGVRRGGGLR
jgi:hypothetical protein